MRTSSTPRMQHSDPAFCKTHGGETLCPTDIPKSQLDCVDRASNESASVAPELREVAKRLLGRVVPTDANSLAGPSDSTSQANSVSADSMISLACDSLLMRCIMILMVSVGMFLSGLQSRSHAACGGEEHLVAVAGKHSRGANRELVLPLAIHYVAGKFEVTHQTPTNPCGAGGCKSKHGIQSESLPPRSLRNLRVIAVDRCVEFTPSETGESGFGRETHDGRALDGYLFAIEHPPKSI